MIAVDIPDPLCLGFCLSLDLIEDKPEQIEEIMKVGHTEGMHESSFPP